MREITIAVPDNTIKLPYVMTDEKGGWEGEPVPVTYDMIVEVRRRGAEEDCAACRIDFDGGKKHENHPPIV